MTTLSAEQLKADANGWQFYAKQPGARDNSLRIRPINQWITEAREQPVPQMLFGKFWYQGELCIMFSDSNSGKSILAIQIGHSISNGTGIHPFELETEGQPVLYCDFELNSKQLEARYSRDWETHYSFNDNFYRADLNPDLELPEGFETNEDYFNYSLEEGVISTGARVIIIDNITYMRSETEQAKDALSLMKQLKALKNKYNLSILVLAHTPKRDQSKPISSNDLQGSKMLMNFCDSAFAIGKSTQHADKRYLKQIKQRNTAQVYGQNNVCLFNITKPLNFLQFDFEDYGDERAHLKEPRDVEKEELTEKVMELRSKGFSLRDTASQLGISYQKVDRLLRAADKRRNINAEA